MRLSILRKLEAEMAEETISPYEQLRFEVECCGTPLSTYESLKSEYVVLEVDDHYSPKVRLYGVANGRTGIMKLKKALFKAQPLTPGSIIRLLSWERKPSYRFIDGKAKPNYDMLDLWITKYEIIS